MRRARRSADLAGDMGHVFMLDSGGGIYVFFLGNTIVQDGIKYSTINEWEINALTIPWITSSQI